MREERRAPQETVSIVRILTFDIEEWFHILDNDSTRGETEWGRYESRIQGNCERVLELLEQTDTRATFFCLGWIAEKHPHVVRAIADRGYEIASHSYSHQLAYEMTPVSFKADLDRSVKTLADVGGKKIRAYRAPGFSVKAENTWVFDCLLESGILIDCSIFPAGRAHGGFASFGSAQPAWVRWRGGRLKEFPINTRSVLGNDVVFSGGGYFRLFPYTLIRAWTRDTPYLMTYFHPRDFDADQPLITELSAYRRFKAYYGLRQAEGKLRSLLQDFTFTDLSHAEDTVNWHEAPVIDLAEPHLDAA